MVAAYGIDPVLFMLAAQVFGIKESELDVAGGLMGRGVELTEAEYVSLPIPANAELVIFCRSPAAWSARWRGQPPYAWEPEKGAYVGVMKRNGSAKDIVWFRAESCYVFHVMNAWEEGNRIIADVMQFEEAPLFTHPDGSPTDPANRAPATAAGPSISRGNTDRFTQTYLDDLTGEFPRIDDRRAGLASPPRLVRLRQS